MSAILSSSATFQAETRLRRESGFSFSVRSTSSIWSMCPPSGVGQERHCTPYTGPSSPSSSAHSFQMRTPLSCSQRTLESPRKNHSSSPATPLKYTFLVVSRGKDSDRS